VSVAALVLERHFYSGTVGFDVAVLDLKIKFGDLSDPQISKRTGRRLYGRTCGLFPGLVACADKLDDFVDALCHDRSATTR
jgi:hypothetical protein